MTEETVVQEVRGTRFIASSLLKPAWVCQTCGAAVLDYAKHGGWHQNLREVLKGVGSPFGPGQAVELV